MLMLGLAGAVVDLSGTEVSVFDQPKLAKDGVDGSSPMLTSSMADFMKDGSELNASLPGMKVLLLGSMVGYQNVEPRYYTPAEFAEIQNTSGAKGRG